MRDGPPPLDPVYQMDHYDCLEAYDKLTQGQKENIDWYANRYFEIKHEEPDYTGFTDLDEEEQKEILFDCVLQTYLYAKKHGMDPHELVLAIMR